jgi:hypothetical protein
LKVIVFLPEPAAEPFSSDARDIADSVPNHKNGWNMPFLQKPMGLPEYTTTN